MKNLRQAKMAEIIGREVVETQEDLQILLRKEGFDVTQATISRDIKALRVYKTLSDRGTLAQAACSALDAMDAPTVVGTLAGDDTAFIALRSEASANGLVEQLRTVLGE
jgi:transcriptional regulator of arginine metabolism